MPIKLPDLKPSSIPKKMPVFEDNEELSYMRAFGRPDAIVLDSYGEYSILSFVDNFLITNISSMILSTNCVSADTIYLTTLLLPLMSHMRTLKRI